MRNRVGFVSLMGCLCWCPLGYTIETIVLIVVTSKNLAADHVPSFRLIRFPGGNGLVKTIYHQEITRITFDTLKLHQLIDYKKMAKNVGYAYAAEVQ